MLHGNIFCESYTEKIMRAPHYLPTNICLTSYTEKEKVHIQRDYNRNEA